MDTKSFALSLTDKELEPIARVLYEIDVSRRGCVVDWSEFEWSPNMRAAYFPAARRAAAGAYPLIRRKVLLLMADETDDLRSPPCDCITQWRGVWTSECYCQNGGDSEHAVSYCQSKNTAAGIRLRAEESVK